jgi:hypothetical protein
LLDPRDGPGKNPLRKFAERLKITLAAVEYLRDSPEKPYIRAGLRAVAIETLGYFLRRPVIRTAYASAADIPADRHPGAEVEYRDGRWWLLTPAPRDSWRARLYRPEWTEYAYSAARCRLTEQMLTVPAADILAVDTDALYLRRDPGWPDSGLIGAFRHVRTWRSTKRWAYPTALYWYQQLHRGEVEF